MQKLDITKPVDINEEMGHVVDYALQAWDGDKESIRQMVSQAYLAGVDSAKTWFKIPSFILELAGSWAQSRQEFLVKEGFKCYEGYNIDGVSRVAFNFLFNGGPLNDVVMDGWNFGSQCHKVLNDIISTLDRTVDRQKILPKGWQVVKDSGKSANEYFDFFNIQDNSEFKGYDTCGSGAVSFNEGINLAHTFYNATEQGNSAIYTLISYAYSHGLTIREHNNSFELCEEFNRIKNSFDESFNKPLFISDFQSLSENKFFKALMISERDSFFAKPYTSQSELDAYIKKDMEKKNSEPVKAPMSVAQIEVFSKRLIDKMKAEDADPIKIAEAAERKLKYKEAINSIFNGGSSSKNKPK